MISIVCVYNDEVTFGRYLAESLARQTREYELIPIDNTRRRYGSAAEALNAGGKRAKGKYVMFAHQDIRLGSDTWLGDAETLLDSLPDMGIAGVAGCGDDGIVLTNVEHGEPPAPAGKALPGGPEAIQTVDECLFIVPKAVFDRLGFDEHTCDDWHLYAADFALSCKNMGYRAYVLPLPAYHLSGGTRPRRFFGIFCLKALPEGYYRTLAKLLKKHKDNFPAVCITCGTWSTSRPMLPQRAGYFYRYWRKRLIG